MTTVEKRRVAAKPSKKKSDDAPIVIDAPISREELRKSVRDHIRKNKAVYDALAKL